MKKLFILFIVLFVSFLWAADSTTVISADGDNPGLSDVYVGGVDVVKYILFDNAEDTEDTVAADDRIVLGPFPLGLANEMNYKSMNLVGTNLGAADSFAVYYQYAATNSVLDTSTRWHALGDTLAPDGVQNTVLDLSSVAAKYVWLMFLNQTASAAIIPDWQWLYFRKNKDYTK